MIRWVLAATFVLFLPTADAREVIRLANNPALSPDGQSLAFDWNGDVWLAPSAGGEARPLTLHPARDSAPKFSPDGKEIAFTSNRDGSSHVYTIPTTGGVPKQLTFHTAGSLVQEWTPDGKALLIKATRDHFWRHGERFFTIPRHERAAERLVFDDYGDDGTLSPDGKMLLFTREGERWWRKGYKGSRVSQVWLYNLEQKTFAKILHKEFGCRWPIWKPDGKGFYFVGEHARGANLFVSDLTGKNVKQLTRFKEESVVFPAISRDGTKIVFRHLFDLYSLTPGSGDIKKLELYHNADRSAARTEYRELNSATSAAFSRDGLEIAFVAGGDLWVMDTILREPRQVTRTATDESNPLFAHDGQSILFVSNLGDRFAISRAVRNSANQYWWQNHAFTITHLTILNEAPTNLRPSPDGKTLAFVRGRGDLCLLDLEAKKVREVFTGWNPPDFDWSPDGKWFVYSQLDAEFNRDIWLLRSDGTGKPFNLSRHPHSEYNPVWSPDGKMIAFAGRRASGEPGGQISLVWLSPDDDDQTARDRKLKQALDRMKGRTPGKGGANPEPKKAIAVEIDFDGLHERIQRINLGEGAANALFWSPDSRQLAFTGSHEGKTGTFVIDVVASSTPKVLTTTAGANPVWLKAGNQIVWLVAGVPTSTPGVAAAPTTTPTPTVSPIPKKKGFAKSQAQPAATGGGYTFSVRQQVDLPARNAAVFDTSWRIMRDHWYDAKLGNSDWIRVRAKYRDLAGNAPDAETVATCIQMMLGELNGSHLGFTPSGGVGKPLPPAPRDVTAHLGVRFDHAFPGPGLKVRDVLPRGPADKKRSRLVPGDVVQKIDGREVHRDLDLTVILNGPLDREISLRVQGADGAPRDVALRPIAYLTAQALLYEQWLRHNRKSVEAASGGKFGYLHISAMSMPNFRKFEEELVSQGAGKDGLVIDVRENPGGSIADHLLTALIQPVHAITVPRGGGPGYPLDRKVYISWHKPIVVLCNQNSGSNAEIFSHAVKTLKRGHVVGVPTAGAVISTGAVQVMDAGILRLPTRGWFTLNDGEDMEKNGAVPHHVLWLDPCTLPQGRDAQLTKALEILHADVAAWKARPQPKLKLSTERP